MTLVEQLKSKLDEVRGDPEEKFWYLSVEGASINPKFIYNRAKPFYADAEKIGKKAGLSDFEVTQIGYSDFTFVLTDSNIQYNAVVRMAKKLADLVRDTTSPDSIEEFGGVVTICKDVREGGIPEDIESFM